jgi:predicted PurR-regulated permease PerM
LDYRTLAARTLVQSSVVAVVVLVAVVPLALLGLGAWMVAPDVAAQWEALSGRIPVSFDALRQRLADRPWMERAVEGTARWVDLLPDGSRLMAFVGTGIASVFGAAGALLVAAVLGLFIAADPRPYAGGLLRLFPPARRSRIAEVTGAVRDVLGGWLLAKLFEMAIVGVFTTFGLWLLGIDLALVLGLITAAMAFVPNIGPFIAFLPAALIAFTDGPATLAMVALLYTTVQAVESYLLTPLLQQRMVNLPPALTIAMQFLLGFLAGALGVIVAAPLTAAALVGIRMLYVEDVIEARA